MYILETNKQTNKSRIITKGQNVSAQFILEPEIEEERTNESGEDQTRTKADDMPVLQRMSNRSSDTNQSDITLNPESTKKEKEPMSDHRSIITVDNDNETNGNETEHKNTMTSGDNSGNDSNKPPDQSKEGQNVTTDDKSIKTYIPNDWNESELRLKLGSCSPLSVNFTPDQHDSQFQVVEMVFDSVQKKDLAMKLLQYVQGNTGRSSKTFPKRPASEEKYVEVGLEPVRFTRPDVPEDEGTPPERKNSLRIPEFEGNESDDEDESDPLDSVIFVCFFFFFFFFLKWSRTSLNVLVLLCYYKKKKKDDRKG
ncbi:hypothetical protein RFI_19090 [Reticulomyxa filosa]|uniref:Uncharacterized protein n=1 Tax=Reticulomyxa filosa TaxID=46433 RepID=X6MWG8_RETFI|nr:hypothetical protein RFI_19090 [Reticulomyxa filosa]|eukprot:ETO18189.1 hypothetical protein RFI_19090 [Reticulomyxa filosa]